MGRTSRSLNRVLSRFQARRHKPGDKTKAINWDELHQKLSAGSAQTTWGTDLSEAQLAEAWARRATQMARPIESQDQGDQLELAVIRLGREIYGVDVRYVYEIRPLTHLTRVPRTPPWVAGVVNLRGRIVSVLDLQKFLNLPRAETDGAPSSVRHLAVVETAAMEMALLVDEVMAIEILPAHKIQEAPTAVRGIRAEYVRGVVVRDQTGSAPAETANGHTHAGKAILVVLDLPALLADKQLIVHEELG